MARIATTGWELNSTSNAQEADGNSGSPAVQAVTILSGSYSLQITSLSSGTLKSQGFQFGASPADGPFFFRVRLQIATLPSAENRIITLMGGANPASNIRAYITLDNGGLLRLYDEDGVIGSPSGALSLGVAYAIGIQYDRTPAGGSEIVRATLDGVEFAGASNRNLSAGISGIAVGGNHGAEAQTTGDWFFDDIAVNDDSGSFQNTYPLDGKVLHLRPDAAGDTNDWTNTYANLDEVTPDDATTLVETQTSGDISEYNVDSPTALGSGDTINAVGVGGKWRSTSIAGTQSEMVLRIKASSGGTVEESAAFTIASTSWRTNNGAFSFKTRHLLVLYDLPGASTSAWTKAILEDAQVGMRQTVNSTGFTQVSALWLMVDYSPATGSLYEEEYTETIVIVDTAIKIPGKTLSDAVTIVDTKIFASARTLIDTIVIVDVLTASKVAVQDLLESIAITDTLQRVIGAVRTETIVIVDSVLRVSARTLSEVITIVDTVLRTSARTLTDTVTIVDTVLKTGGKVLSDSVTVVDTFIRSSARTLSESVPITDTVVRAYGAIKTEVVTIADTVLRTSSRIFSEAVTIIDEMVTAVFVLYIQQLLESISIQETLVKARGKILNETVTIADRFVRRIKWYVRRASGFFTRNNDSWYE